MSVRDMCPDEHNGDYLRYLQTRNRFICSVLTDARDPWFWCLIIGRSLVIGSIVWIIFILAGD